MKAKLKFYVKPWTGWTEKQPEDKELEFEIAEGEILQATPRVLEGLNNDLYLLTVNIANSGQVKVAYKGLTIEKQDGTVSILNAPRAGSVDLQLEEPMRFATPTMDGGTHIIISLEEIK